MKFPVYFRVSVAGKTRFESVFQDQAEEFAKGVYRETKVIADIHEVTR